MSRKSRHTQDAVPVETIFQSGVVKNKEGGMALVLEVTPLPLAMLDQEERQALLREYHGFLLRLPGPVFLQARDTAPDLAAYLENLSRRARQAPCAGLHAAGMELHGWTKSLLAGQAVQEKRFYVVVPYQTRPEAQTPLAALLSAFVPSARAKAEERRRAHLAGQVQALLQMGRDLAGHLSRLGLPTRLLTAEEVLNVLRAAYDPQRPPIVVAPPGQDGAGSEDEEEA